MKFDTEDVLLAPIQIDALPVGAGAPSRQIFQWTNLAPNFAKLGSDAQRFPFGTELVSDGDPLKAADALEAGIHLHFRLPRAFRHGHKYVGSDGISFPLFPNRWLVRRFVNSGAADGERKHRSFLLRSDGEPAASTDIAPSHIFPGQTTEDGRISLGFPRSYDTPVDLIRLGACETVTGRLPEAEERMRAGLTAVGLGDPTFSVHYQASRQVLGFHDTLDDIDAADGAVDLTYLVSGWFSSAEDDILFDAAAGILWSHGALPGEPRPSDQTTSWEALSKQERARIRARVAEIDPDTRASLWRNLDARDTALSSLSDWLEAQNWRCDALDGDTPRPDVRPPWRIVCHGTVRSVRWRGPEEDHFRPAETDGPAKRDSEVFPIDPENAPPHRVSIGQAPSEALAALVVPGAIEQDLLAALQEGVLGQPVTRAQLHAELHTRRFEGVDGETRYTTQADEAQSSPGQAPARAPAPTADLLDAVGKLNVDQARLATATRKLNAARSQLRGLWKLEAASLEAGGGSSEADYGAQRRVFASVVDRLAEDRHEALRRRDQRLAAGDTECAAGDLATAMNAAAVPFRLTSTSTEPFFQALEPVIAIAGPAARVRNAAPRPGIAPCRLRGDVIATLRATSTTGREVTIDGHDMIDACGLPANQKFDALHTDLLAEALLRDAEMVSAERLAKLVTDREDAIDAVRDARSAMPDATAFDFRWQGAPWIPLALVWDIGWEPDYAVENDTPLQNDLIDAHWTLKDEGEDLQALGQFTAPAPELSFKGHAVLSRSQFDRLKVGLREIRADHPVVEAIEDEWACYQRLAGLDAALTGRRTSPELPPFNFEAWFESANGELVLESEDALHLSDASPGAAPSWPQSTPFLPIRSGRLRLRHLAIVDAFGQTRKILTDQIRAGNATPRNRASQGIRTSEDSTDFSARPQPRLTQPARLRFDWTEGEAAGPVAGWVVVNWLEQAFGLYAADGRPVAVLQKRLGGASASSAFISVPVPGEAVTPRPDRIEDPDLRYFHEWALGLSPRAGTLLFNLVGEAVEAADERVPEDDPAVSLLMGRPLALARADLGLDLMGLPQSRPSLKQTDDGKSYEIETHGLEQVRWPVRLGGARLRNDGLVGFFDRTDVASGAFAVTQESTRDALPEGFTRQDLRVTAAATKGVLMLMDPQARVHATTGILPRRHIALPDEIERGAGRVRDVFFQTAPVLGFSADAVPAMPVPSDDFGEWSWAWRPDVSTTATDPNLIRAAERGGFTGSWPNIAEGWLKLRTTALRGLSLWTLEPAKAVPSGSVVTLAWSAPEADLTLERRIDGADEEAWEPLSDLSDGRLNRSGKMQQQVDESTTFRITAERDGERATREVTVAAVPKREDDDD